MNETIPPRPTNRAAVAIAIWTLASLILWAGAIGCWFALDGAGIPEAISSEVAR